MKRAWKRSGNTVTSVTRIPVSERLFFDLIVFMKAGMITAFREKNSQFKSANARKRGELAYQLELAKYQIRDSGGVCLSYFLEPKWLTVDGLSLL